MTDEAPIETLTRYIVEAKAQRHAAMTGSVTTKVWRAGKGIEMRAASISELNAYITEMERELAGLVAASEGRPARRAIGIAWKN